MSTYIYIYVIIYNIKEPLEATVNAIVKNPSWATPRGAWPPRVARPPRVAWPRMEAKDCLCIDKLRDFWPRPRDTGAHGFVGDLGKWNSTDFT